MYVEEQPGLHERPKERHLHSVHDPGAPKNLHGDRGISFHSSAYTVNSVFVCVTSDSRDNAQVLVAVDHVHPGRTPWHLQV